MGRPPKSIEEKRRIGNPGRRPLTNEPKEYTPPAELTAMTALARIAEIVDATDAECVTAHSDGPRVAAFIESFCRITKGKGTGDLLVLRDWQLDLLERLFAWDDNDSRKHRRALIGMPRKNGKSALGAGIALYGLLADDEPGAEVYSCAGEKEQARIVFAMAKRMIELDPVLSVATKLYRDAIDVPATASVYRVLSAEAYSKEGLNPSLVVFDEVHVQPNEDLWDVMTLGSGTRERPLILGITTAGVMTDTRGQDSLCYQLYQYGKNLLAGEIDDPTFFFHWWEPEQSDCDWRAPDVWAGCNPALGDFLHAQDFEVAVRQTRENAFRTKRLNQWVNAADSWLPYGAWEELQIERHLKDGEEVVLGFDGSFNGDCTALVAATPDGFVAPVALWQKPENVDEWHVDIEAVEAKIIETCKTYDVREIACDPYRWQRSMQVLENEGLPVVEFPQSVPRMVAACAKFFDAVMDKRIHHNGDVDLTRHMNHAVIKTDGKGPRLVKEHKMSKRHVDLAVAAVMAYDRAAQPEEPAPTIRFV